MSKLLDQLELSEWGERGFAKAIAVCTNAHHNGSYPTQDSHSPQDEADYIQGFNLGMGLFKSNGLEVAKAYADEAQEKGLL
jgi:hypothetical protein